MSQDLPIFRSAGKLVYDPQREGMKRRRDWWCVVQVDPEIARYYRWFVERYFLGRTINQPNWLCKPSWGAHISVVRSEKPRPPYRHFWKKYDGERIEFVYRPYPRVTRGGLNELGTFWFIDVDCPRLHKIRRELGLPTFYHFHITIGRDYTSDGLTPKF